MARSPGRPVGTDSQESRKDALQRAIIDAALMLFSDLGYHGTTVPSVLQQAAVGASSLYRLFPSKEALVNAVFLDAKGRLERALAGAAAPAETPSEARAQFCALWDRLAAFAKAEPVAFRFLELQDHTPYLDGASRQKELAVLAPLALMCMDFQRRGFLRDDVGADVVLAHVWGAFVGLVKAARLGYLALDDARLAQARDASWRSFATPSHPTPSRRRKTP